MRPTCCRPTERVEAKIAWFHGPSDGVSGSPRIRADLREDGETISRKTVAKAMRKFGLRKFGLRGICPRRWRTTTQRDCEDVYPPDAAKRVWDTDVLIAVWVGATSVTCAPGKDGCTWDNAMAESFFATLKTECNHRLSGPPRPAPSLPSGHGSRTATTGAAGTPRSAKSAP